MSGIMISIALFQFGLGITIINRKAVKEIMVKKEMKLVFSCYGTQSNITQNWNKMQSEVSDFYNFIYNVPTYFISYLSNCILILKKYQRLPYQMDLGLLIRSPMSYDILNFTDYSYFKYILINWFNRTLYKIKLHFFYNST